MIASTEAVRTKRNGPQRRDPNESLSDVSNERTHLGRLLCRGADATARAACLATLLERGVGPDDFFLPDHQSVFREIIAIVEETGDAPDYAAVERRFRDRGDLDEIGRDCLQELAEAEPHSHIPAGLTESLMELAKRRRLFWRTRDLQEIVADPAASLADAIDFADGLTSHLGGTNRIQKFSIGQIRQAFPDQRPALIEGLARAGEVVNLISGTKIGKSWLIYMILMQYVLRHPLFGRFATAGGRVLLIDNELHAETLSHRLQTVADALGARVEELEDKFEVWPVRENPQALDQISAELRKYGKGHFSLVALDARYRFLAAGEDENSNSDQTAFYTGLCKLAATTGAAIIVVHHSTKGSQSDKRTTDVGAGGGAQSRAADTHLVLREHSEDGVAVLDAAVRSFAPIEPLCLRWAFPLWQPDDSLDPTNLKGGRSAEDRQSARDGDSDTAVLQICQTWRSRSEIRTATGFNSDRANRAVRRLIDAGYLEAETQNRKGNQCEVFRKTIHAN